MAGRGGREPEEEKTTSAKEGLCVFESTVKMTQDGTVTSTPLANHAVARPLEKHGNCVAYLFNVLVFQLFFALGLEVDLFQARFVACQLLVVRPQKLAALVVVCLVQANKRQGLPQEKKREKRDANRGWLKAEVGAVRVTEDRPKTE